MGLRIDNKRCLRCGMCTGIEPDVFEFNDAGDIEIKEDKITEENKKLVEEAKNTCPVKAIEEVEEEKVDTE